MGQDRTAQRGMRKVRQGVVAGVSGRKSVVVRVESRRRHPLYGKVVRRVKRLHAHDEDGIAAVGDTVRIVETRPLSRLKRWRVVEKVRAAQGADRAAEEPQGE